MGSMLLNMAANILGLGNAATPLGLRAMKDLETLNPRPGTATNAMCTLLAINTSSIQLIPVTAIAILAANQSSNPTAIVGTSLMATTCAATAAVTAAKLLSAPADLPLAAGGGALAAARNPRRRNRAAANSAERQVAREGSRFARAAAVVGRAHHGGLWAVLPLPVPAAGVPDADCWESAGCPPDSGQRKATFVRIVDAISKLSIPFMLSVFPLYAALRRREGL